MLKSKKIVIGILVFALAFALTGCSGSGNEDVSNKAEKGKVELSFWAYQPENKGGIKELEDIVKSFNETNQNIDVQLTMVPHGDFTTKINAAIAAEKAPDISYLDQSLSPKFAKDNILLKLDKYINGEKGINLEEFYQGALNTNKVKDSFYGLPLNQVAVALFYNKDLVHNPPETWEELLEISKSIYEESNGQKAAFEVPAGDGWGAWLFPAFVAANGGRMANEDTGKATLNEKPVVEALELWKKLKEYSPNKVIKSSNAFENDSVGMKISGPWEIYGYQENFPDLNYGISLIPHKQGESSGSNIGGENIVAYNSTKHPEAAWEFMKYLTKDKVQMRLSKVTGNFPIKLAVAKEDRFTKDKHLSVFMEQMKTSQARPRIEEWVQINDEVIAKAIELGLDGRDAQEALDWANKRANEIIDQ